MPAYLIVIAHVDDRDAFMRGYAPAAGELVERMGGKYLLRAPGAVGLEGDGGDGASVVVSQWSDMAALRAFWDSTDYARIRRLRDGIASCQVLAVESAAVSLADGEDVAGRRGEVTPGVGCRGSPGGSGGRGAISMACFSCKIGRAHV